VTTTVAVRVDADTSRMYFATYDGSLSTLYSIDLPTVPNALRGVNAAALAALIKPVVSFGSDTVVAMLVIPPLVNRTSDNQLFCDSGTHCLVIATRRAGGTDGQTLMFDPVSLRTAKLAFPGPVRFLTTHPQTIDPLTLFVARGAGQRIFGILDEEKCGGSACGGVLAVETVAANSASGGFPVAQYENDGGTMIPLNFGDSLPVGLAVGGNPAYTSNDGGPTVTRVLTSNDGGLSLAWYASLGIATAANGSVTFFDATTLQQIDGNDEAAHARQATYVDENGYPADWVTGVDAGLDESLNSHTITVADGVWRSQAIYTYYEGVLTEAALPIAALSTTVALPASLTPRLKLGDFLIFATPSGFCADEPITAIGADTVSIAQVPADCDGVVSFIIRAGPLAPFALFRTQVPQYLGRAAAGEEFVWNGAPVYVRLSGYNPETPALKVGFGLDTVTTPPPRGALWQFFIASGYSPYSFIVDPNSVGCATQLPGKVLFDEARAHIYVIYPSSNSLVDIDPSLAQRVALGALQGTYCYR
jgi:hypothetical protein